MSDSLLSVEQDGIRFGQAVVIPDDVVISGRVLGTPWKADMACRWDDLPAELAKELLAHMVRVTMTTNGTRLVERYALGAGEHVNLDVVCPVCDARWAQPATGGWEFVHRQDCTWPRRGA